MSTVDGELECTRACAPGKVQVDGRSNSDRSSYADLGVSFSLEFLSLSLSPTLRSLDPVSKEKCRLWIASWNETQNCKLTSPVSSTSASFLYVSRRVLCDLIPRNSESKARNVAETRPDAWHISIGRTKQFNCYCVSNLKESGEISQILRGSYWNTKSDFCG